MLYPVRPKQTLSMQTRDHIRLDADVYYPDTSDLLPVLLMRQPYGRAIASTVVYAHPTWYAEQGYIVVIQDVRGRGSSGGEFDLFAHEIEDGEDAVNWAATLPQSSGRVGMYGFSYQGMTQLYAAANCPSALKTICPAMIGYDLYQDWAYEGGGFCYQMNLAWALQLATETARRKGDEDAYRTLYAAAHNLSLWDPVHVHSGILKQLAPDSHYHHWLNHPEPDAYWQKLSPCTYMDKVDLPMLHIGGWFDPHLRGTLRFYREMSSRSAPQHLTVGAWGHLPWGRQVGAIDYGAEANSPIDRLQIRWFDHFLKGKDTGLLRQSPVCWFEMGTNQWRSFEHLPQPVVQPYRLVTTGLAGLDDREGRLEELRGPDDRADVADVAEESSLNVFEHPELLPAAQPSTLKVYPPKVYPTTAPDTFTHDPWRPVPALGGHAAFPAGAFNRTSIDSRSDVLTYTSLPLSENLHLAGEIVAELYCMADAPSFDLCGVFSEVKPEGSVYNLTQGYCRITATPVSPVLGAPIPTQLHRLTLQATCVCIPVDSAIRLSISAACFPAYAVNPGTGSPQFASRLIEAQVITVSLYSDHEQPCRLLLPVRLLEPEI